MTLYTDPKGRKLTDEAIARAWILAHREKAAKLLDSDRAAYPRDFGIVVEQDEDGTVRVATE